MRVVMNKNPNMLHSPLQLLVVEECLEHLQVVGRRVRVVDLEVFAALQRQQFLAEAQHAAAHAAVGDEDLHRPIGAATDVVGPCAGK